MSTKIITIDITQKSVKFDKVIIKVMQGKKQISGLSLADTDCTVSIKTTE
jgi:ribosomal silencing factor RsfS